MEEKLCKKCGESKPLTKDYFYFVNDKAQPICKDCSKERGKDYYHNNKEKHNEVRQKYVNSDLGKNAYFRAKGYKLNNQNFTVESYNLLCLKQENKCAVCNKEGYLYIDHNHKTGEVRGLLYSNCNVGIGKIGDKIENFENVIKYLKNGR